MDTFLVSARKYRPATFDEVIGQEHITETLINEIKQNRLAQAFLFTGPRGVGKTTCARILARVINTEADPKIDPKYDFAFNIFELDAASNNSVDDIRNLVEQVRIPPQIGRYKVYTIDEVHMLSSNAFNAFLKTLEEPPPYAIFILATTERNKILPTILSRCQIFNFKRIEPASIVKQLQAICKEESISAEEQALHVIASKADGGLRDALSMFDQMVSFSADKNLTYASVIQNLNVLDQNYYFEVCNDLNAGDFAAVLIKFDEILSNGFDGQYFLNGLASHFRDILVVKNTGTAYLVSSSESVLPKYKKQAETIQTGFLLNAINIADQYDQSYKASRNQRLHIELALIKIAHINQTLDLLEEVKKKSPELSEQDKPTKPKADSSPKPDSDSSSNSPKTLRLGNLGNMVDDPSAFLTQNKLKDSALTTNEKELSQDAGGQENVDLKALLLSFAELKKKEGKAFAHSLLKEIVAEQRENTIIITLTNIRDQIQLDEIKTDLLRYIQENTRKEFSIEFNIEKSEPQLLKVYTNKDKFNFIAQKNPFLIEFSKELGMELE